MTVDPTPRADPEGGGPAPDDSHGRCDHPALRYFCDRYPGRDRLLGSLMFRSGEASRRRVVLPLLPQLDGLDVLDAGCGDGDFLSRVVKGRPKLLRLEDLVLKLVQGASSRVTGLADRIEVAVTDSAAADGNEAFDVVLAIGVADYQPDWAHFVARLFDRTSGRLIVDIPREADPFNQVRRLWLRLHGIHLQTSTRRGLAARLGPSCPTPGIHVTRHSWVLCLDRH